MELSTHISRPPVGPSGGPTGFRLPDILAAGDITQARENAIRALIADPPANNDPGEILGGIGGIMDPSIPNVTGSDSTLLDHLNKVLDVIGYQDPSKGKGDDPVEAKQDPKDISVQVKDEVEKVKKELKKDYEKAKEEVEKWPAKKQVIYGAIAFVMIIILIKIIK